jgi:DNA-binding IclR family transcriptional regulator
VAVRDTEGTAVAGLAVSMPSARYDRHQLPTLVSTLRSTAHDLETDLAGHPSVQRA